MESEDLGGLESLQVLLQQNPNSLTFGRVADALMKLGRVDEAIQLCEDGLRRHPSYVTGHMVLGKCYLKKKLFDQAEKEFKRVLLFDPKYLAAHKYYGDLMREIGWDNTCEMSYRKISQIDPLDQGVRAVIDDLAQKSKMQKLEPASPIRRAPVEAPAPPAAIEPLTPMQSDDFFSVAEEAPDNDLLRYQPAAEADSAPLPDFVASSELLPPSLPAPEADEERFSYILDDIFQDEVLDERPAPTVPTNKNQLPTSNSRPPNAPRDDEADARDQSMLRRLDEIDRALGANASRVEPPPRPVSKIPTRPVDFDLDFDEAAPSALNDVGKSSGFGLENLAPSQNKTPGRPNAPPARLPARRQRLLESHAPDDSSSITAAGEREKIVTPTLGEIYAAQGQYTKAIGVFELLSKKEPNNRHYREKIDYLKKRLQETQNAG
jgi:tetratricopeptide (TPR) repeat protein